MEKKFNQDQEQQKETYVTCYKPEWKIINEMFYCHYMTMCFHPSSRKLREYCKRFKGFCLQYEDYKLKRKNEQTTNNKKGW